MLRWIVALAVFIAARRIEDDAMNVSFGMPNLSWQADTWGLVLKFHAANCLDRTKTIDAPQKTFIIITCRFQGSRWPPQLEDEWSWSRRLLKRIRYLVRWIVCKTICEQTYWCAQRRSCGWCRHVPLVIYTLDQTSDVTEKEKLSKAPWHHVFHLDKMKAKI